MYNQLMDAMLKILNELFPKVKIGTTPVKEQEEPCIQVGILESTEKHVNGQRYIRSVSMFMNYDPKNSKQPYRDVNRVLGELMDKVEVISLEDGSLLRGNNRKAINQEGILHFQVEFDVSILKNENPSVSMEDMDLKEKR